MSNMIEYVGTWSRVFLYLEDELSLVFNSFGEAWDEVVKFDKKKFPQKIELAFILGVDDSELDVPMAGSVSLVDGEPKYVSYWGQPWLDFKAVVIKDFLKLKEKE